MRSFDFRNAIRAAIATAFSLAVAGSATEARAGLYAYAQQEVNNFTFSGATIDQLQTLTTSSAVQVGVPSGNQGQIGLMDAAQSYVGPAGTAPAENFFGQGGLVNPDYVRGDVLISPTFDINNVAEGYLTSAGQSAGIGAWSVGAEITLTAAGTVQLGFSYENLLQVIYENGFPPAGQVSASYAFNFTIAIPGPGGAILFESSPTAVNSSVSLVAPGSITSPGSGSVSIVSTILAAGTYQATITGSERVFLAASAVPEPSTIVGLAFGVFAAAGVSLRRKSRV